MLACHFLWRNVRKQKGKKKNTKAAASPSLIQAVLHGFNSVFLNHRCFSSLDKDSDIQEAASKRVQIKCF